MATFAYRAVDRRGTSSAGEVQANDRAEALHRIRGLGVVPVEVKEQAARQAAPSHGKIGGRGRAEITKALAELGVLINAGLPLDRAVALCVDNIEQERVASEFRRMLGRVREGVPLSQAMAEQPALFSPSARAVIEAGEANGQLGNALERVARAANQAEEMRRTVTGAMIYPMALLLLAFGVILMILLYVVPQFESLFASAQGKLPASSLALMAASKALRTHGLLFAGGLVIVILGIRQLIRQPGVRAQLDTLVLRVPQLGMLIRYIEAARLARTLGGDRKSTRLNSSHTDISRMPSSA